MTPKTIALGDIHGCLTALETLLPQLDIQPGDQLIALGDYIDRGSNSKGVLDRLLALREECRLVPLLGNHEEMLLYLLRHDEPKYLTEWLKYGGTATLQSYGYNIRPADLPAEHLAFIEACLPYYETETHAFFHANYFGDRPFDSLHEYTLRWESLFERMPTRHISGKEVIVGHTAQSSGEILDRGYLRCIDTKCYGGGWLTALNVHTGQYWQSNEQGESRTGQL